MGRNFKIAYLMTSSMTTALKNSKYHLKEWGVEYSLPHYKILFSLGYKNNLPQNISFKKENIFPSSASENAANINFNKIKEYLNLVELKRLQQVHGMGVINVETISEQECLNIQSDGLIIHQGNNVGLGIECADCFPLLVVNEHSGQMVALHCGWRSTALGIIEKSLMSITQKGNFKAFIGAGIGKCCFEVSNELEQYFSNSYFKPIQNKPNKKMLDLEKAIIDKLIMGGIKDKNIFPLGLCTSCLEGDNRFFSYRKSGGLCGRQMGVIAKTI